MKRLFSLLLTVCTLLAACTGNSRSETTAETTQAAPPLLGLCFRDRDADPDYCDALEKALTDAGYRLCVTDSKNDQSRQDALVADLVRDGCRMILSEPVMVSAQDAVLQATAGAPLLLLNYEPEAVVLESRSSLAYIGFDPAQPGILQAQAVQLLPDGGDLNEDGTVTFALLTGPEDHLDAQLHTEGAQWETGECLDIAYTDWSAQQGQIACGKLLSQYGLDLEVILCGNGPLAQSALAAVEQRGWRAGQDGYLLALGGDAEILSLILQGSVSATIIPDVNTQRELILQTVSDLLTGTQPESVTYAPYITVTADNATDYLP